MNFKNNWKNFLQIFITFFKIGCFTFGGGYAMIPLIEKEVIDKKSWIKEEEIIDIFALSESIPGAIAINSSILIGYKIKGRMGAYAAALGVILPSFMIITIIAAFFSKFQDNPFVLAAFKGIRATVVGLIGIAAAKIGKTAIKDKWCLSLTILAIILVFVFDLHAIIAITGGALFGIVLYKVSPSKLNVIIEKGVNNSDLS